MRKIGFAILVLALCVQMGTAQDYTLKKAWEFININDNPLHPWLKAQQGTNWEHDGANTMDFFSTPDSLRRGTVSSCSYSKTGLMKRTPRRKILRSLKRIQTVSALWISPGRWLVNGRRFERGNPSIRGF